MADETVSSVLAPNNDLSGWDRRPALGHHVGDSRSRTTTVRNGIERYRSTSGSPEQRPFGMVVQREGDGPERCPFGMGSQGGG
jgi:hypothetical protein